MAVAAILAYEVDKFMDRHRPGPGERGDKDYQAGRLVLLSTLQRALEMDFSRGVYSEEGCKMLHIKLEKLAAEASKALRLLGLKDKCIREGVRWFTQPTNCFLNFLRSMR